MKRKEVAEKVSRAIHELYGTKLSDALKQRWKDGKMPVHITTPEERISSSIRMTGLLNPMKRPEVVQKVREKMNILFTDPEYKTRILTSQRTYRNKLETRMEELLSLWDIHGFRYTGDRTFWVGPCDSGKYRNPDFVNTATSKVILTCGRHWHTDESIKIQVLDYVGRGYQVLIVWDSGLFDKNNKPKKDVKDIEEEVRLFCRDGVR